jgi:hypothetical protein
MRRFLNMGKLPGIMFFSGLLFGLFGLSSNLLFAMSNCTIMHHAAPSEADTAFLNGDFAKAEGLYRAALTKNPGAIDPSIGLVHALLRQQKVLDAADAVHTWIGVNPAPAALLTLLGEVEFRQGEPWVATETSRDSFKLDPCNPRTIYLIGKLAELNSRYATARKMLISAHQLDPEDQEIRAAWMRTLPIEQRIHEIEDYLLLPRGDDEQTIGELKTELEQLKAWNKESHQPCTLTSQPASTEIPLAEIRTIRGEIPFPSLGVKVNGHLVNLPIDTSYNARLPIEGFSGLLILQSAAKNMGLKPVFQNSIPGTGPQGPRPGYFAYADSISIGGVEFHNCAVQVLNGAFGNDADGVMSMSLFSDFLVTLDSLKHKLKLDPLPARSGGASVDGLYDRTIAPEMKDYSLIYRSGSDLIFPAYANGKYPMLFVLDTAIWNSVLTPEAAHEIVDGHKESKYEIRDSKSKVDTSFSAGNVALFFAQLNQNIGYMHTFDTSRFSKDTGLEISGLIGNAALRGTVIHIDYRDGLVKLDFDPKNTGAFAH